MPQIDLDNKELSNLAEAAISLSRFLIVTAELKSGAVTLSPLEALLLRQTDRNPGSTSSTLAMLLGMQVSNTSTALRTLEERGLIRRIPDPDDGRRVRIYATDLALENRDKVRKTWSEALGQLMDPDTDPRPGVELLMMLERNLQKAAIDAQ